MNWDQIQGDWNHFCDKVKQKWGKLTDDELTAMAGHREQFIGCLQEKCGCDQEQAEKELNEFVDGLKPRAVTAEQKQSQSM